MKTKLTVLVAFVFAAMLSSCGNDAEMEKRIANLERRINQLENGGVVRNATTPVPATTASQSVETNLTANAAFKWDNTIYNFGTIKQGEVVNYTFKFTNNGTEDLQIQSTSASCGCTVPQHTKEPIPPGGTGQIVVRYDSKGKSGQQSPVITVVANTSPRQSRLSLRGFVQVNAAPQP
ncbi:DUF1573 domain-containing protein [Roseivirga sp.]|uniref:DUF1573 domain-containing protein n=1 Tax=Roseivirga sp. TaxID=1964215 RepID=UPI003B8C705B